MSTSDELLLARLRDLALVDAEALLAGVPAERHVAFLRAHADDLADALSQARQRARELMAAVAVGPDPLALLEAGAVARAREGGRAASERAARRLAVRAQECRALARLYDMTAHLLPRLLEVDRRRAALTMEE